MFTNRTEFIRNETDEAVTELCPCVESVPVSESPQVYVLFVVDPFHLPFHLSTNSSRVCSAEHEISCRSTSAWVIQNKAISGLEMLHKASELMVFERSKLVEMQVLHVYLLSFPFYPY